MGESGYMESVPVDWISLRDVEDKDLEMLREERNRWSTRSNLEDCRVISQEDQTRWFVGGGARGIKVAECDGAVVGIAADVADGHLGQICQTEQVRHLPPASLRAVPAAHPPACRSAPPPR